MNILSRRSSLRIARIFSTCTRTGANIHQRINYKSTKEEQPADYYRILKQLRSWNEIREVFTHIHLTETIPAEQLQQLIDSHNRNHEVIL
jgi:hypothetical protein